MDEETNDSYERGRAKLRDVYAGDVVNFPKGTRAFSDVMIETLFVHVWGRDILDIRSRRLLLMGVIAAFGQADTWKVQARAALRRGELSPEELRETLIMLAPYAGYPNVAGLALLCEDVIERWIADGSPGWDDVATSD